MVKQVGFPWGVLNGDLDQLYVELLLKMVRSSSLGAIVILAQDEVHDEAGKVMEGIATFYVPND